MTINYIKEEDLTLEILKQGFDWECIISMEE